MCPTLRRGFLDDRQVSNPAHGPHLSRPAPFSLGCGPFVAGAGPRRLRPQDSGTVRAGVLGRSEEHTSELQSQSNLVCRLLLEKKNRPQGAIFFADAPESTAGFPARA